MKVKQIVMVSMMAVSFAVFDAYGANISTTTDRASDGTDRVTDQVTDRATDRQTDRASDRNSDRASDRITDRASDRRTDHHPTPRQRVNRIFNSLDLNHDGILTLDEWLVRPEQKAPDQFDRIDVNDDELISFEEFMSVFSDGESDIDWEAVRLCVQEQFDFVIDERPEPETLFAQIDLNADGFIDYDEFLTAKIEKATEKFHSIDADGDGGITKEELLEAFLTRQAYREAVRVCIQEQQETDDLLEG